ncbi:NBR1-Ig-like domain-containing protein [Actinoplanes oblitus]|uniref:NBR1-Ig-like domain-containing protein n=1 Tax=Actinoplanes oblitus TaxID=3040509 RepID=A0ABY8WDW7_9ACTN|nr:NBR1-Ig-like domain-containing protein [Actinoplanes oblitus]WIM95105.1 NBR1-Ig-like domain-containing protein [Actinoplanes oblitus]
MEDQRVTGQSIQDGQDAAEFAEQLRDLRVAAGNPSFRKMAGRSGRISHTTLHEAAAGTRFPSWETTREFVRACGADEARWRRRWEDAQRQEVRPADPPPAEALPVPPPADAPPAPSPAPSVAPSVAPSRDEASRVPAIVEATVARDVAAEVVKAGRRRSPWVAAVAAVVAVIAVLGATVRGRTSPESPAAAPSPSPSASAFSDSLIPGDSSRFVADVTIPDGTRVKVNAHFVKVWALANVGTVDWHNRYLERTDPGDDNGCRVPDRVTIGDTPPGEKVMISVPVTAPSRPGKCWVSWKMVDERGQAYFPSRRPVYFMVTVVA